MFSIHGRSSPPGVSPQGHDPVSPAGASQILKASASEPLLLDWSFCLPPDLVPVVFANSTVDVLSTTKPMWVGNIWFRIHAPSPQWKHHHPYSMDKKPVKMHLWLVMTFLFPCWCCLQTPLLPFGLWLGLILGQETSLLTSTALMLKLAAASRLCADGRRHACATCFP